LGGSAAGLALLRRGWRLGRDGAARPPAGRSTSPALLGAAAEVLQAHLAPQAELAQGRARARAASAGLDISDGLSHDLHNLCEASRCGALVEAERVPIHPAVTRLASEAGFDPVELALTGGEEYRLLVALPAGAAAPAGIRLDRVGVLESAPGVRIRRAGRVEPWPRQGYEHFDPHS
jgi:thiamine-monophosphate kinase